MIMIIQKGENMENQDLLTPREAIIILAQRNQGDWEATSRDIKRKVPVDRAELREEKAVTALDPEYPAALMRNSVKMPFVLFYEGDPTVLNSDRIVSVAGVHKGVTEYELENAEAFGAECAKRGVVLCAKAAAGCNLTALSACAKAGGKCIAVLGSGLGETVYPCGIQAHAVFKAITASGGVIVSEYPKGTQASPTRMAMSNRIVAAIGGSMLVFAMRKSGGGAITVAYALNLGTDIAALPHPIGEDDMCNLLIRDGADVYFGPEDYLDGLFGQTAKERE